MVFGPTDRSRSLPRTLAARRSGYEGEADMRFLQLSISAICSRPSGESGDLTGFPVALGEPELPRSNLRGIRKSPSHDANTRNTSNRIVSRKPALMNRRHGIRGTMWYRHEAETEAFWLFIRQNVYRLDLPSEPTGHGHGKTSRIFLFRSMCHIPQNEFGRGPPIWWNPGCKRRTEFRMVPARLTGWWFWRN